MTTTFAGSETYSPCPAPSSEQLFSRFGLIIDRGSSIWGVFMRFRVTLLSAILAFLCLASIVPQSLAGKKDKHKPDVGPAEQKRAIHALNRRTFGPRPGDVEQVMAMGVDRWIDLELHPEKISDAALESRLAGLSVARMSPHEVAEHFPDNALIKQVMDGKRAMPSDPARRAIYQVQIARLEAKQDRKRELEQVAVTAPAISAPGAADTAKTAEELAAAATPEMAPKQMSNNTMSSGDAVLNSSSSQMPQPAAKRSPA